MWWWREVRKRRGGASPDAKRVAEPVEEVVDVLQGDEAKRLVRIVEHLRPNDASAQKQRENQTSSRLCTRNL
eukprot:3847723-Pleurochrysis_carterae.AAC.1